MKRYIRSLFLFTLFSVLSCYTTSRETIDNASPDQKLSSPLSEELIIDDISLFINPEIYDYIQEKRALYLIAEGVHQGYKTKIYSFSQTRLSSLGFRIAGTQETDLMINNINWQLAMTNEESFNELIKIGAWEASNLIGLLDLEYGPLDKSLEYKNALNFYNASTVTFKILDISKNEVLLSLVAIGIQNRDRMREDQFINKSLSCIYDYLEEHYWEKSLLESR